jgi:hypothetical protein
MPRPFDEKKKQMNSFSPKNAKKKCGEEIMTDKSSAIDNN